MTHPIKICWLAVLLLSVWLSRAATTHAQSVCLPSPRLLTITPPGGQAGSSFEVTIAGDHLEQIEALRFSHPGITAQVPAGSAADNMRFLVTIAPDCPADVHEARVITRLGVSSSRVFSVGNLPEVVQAQPANSADKALALPLNSLCNAVAAARAINYFTFAARQGQHVIVDCAAEGIDSKLHPVVIVADAEGRDLLVERRGGVLDFAVPEDGTYLIKVHDLTFNGGAAYFFRLAVRELPAGERVRRMASTQSVNAFSWPPAGLPDDAELSETEPNNQLDQAQRISLPCDIAGNFYPAADVDRFEFTAQKGDEWWIEVASQRLGLPTDPFVLVQRVVPAPADKAGAPPQLVDVVELNDIASPVKVSSNGYAYDGPPYQAGTSDPLGKLTIPEDGTYRLQLSDQFGGTRSDPRYGYRLVIRRAAPDFALVAWALHMELRNGDRNALSKPVALRGGATVALEVVAVRRDGFEGAIELSATDLPAGVTATGLKIAAGKSRGVLLFTAEEQAPRGLSSAKLMGSAEIGGATVTRPIRLASMAWPVTDAWSEVPRPRLVADVPVSVSDSETAPLSIAAGQDKVWEAKADEQLKIPLALTRRSDFSGATMQLRTFGDVFEQTAPFEISLTGDTAEAVLDLARLKPPAGDHVIAFFGGAVARYRYNPLGVLAAEESLRKLQQQSETLAGELKQLTADAASAPVENKAAADAAVAAKSAEQKELATRIAEAEKRVKSATDAAQPKDIADIIVSRPITIRVQPAEKK